MPKLVHYTRGGPFHGYLRQPYVQEWLNELKDLLAGSNPKASCDATTLGRSQMAHIAVTYKEDSDGK